VSSTSDKAVMGMGTTDALSTIPRRPVPKELRRRQFLLAVADHAVLIALSAIFLVSLIFMILTSFMTDNQAITPEIWPQPFQPKNYADVFHTIPFFRYTFNTMTVAFLSTAGIVLSSIPVAYALSRMRWRGRQAAFVVILGTLMLPYQVTVLPLYIVFARFGWIPSLKPLIIPAFFGDAFSIFLLRQFFRTIPEELSDAARVDGAAIAAVALFSFLYAWNDFFGPLLYVGEDSSSWTLAIGLAEFKALHHVQWNLTMAASLMFMLPVVVLFFLAQKVFIEGVTLSGVKG
jgi:multiple sugar transport system permease protein